MLDFAVAAISVTQKIKDLGAYAGFASILGLAVLSVLYFAQARELKRLREWAGRAPERAAEMQERLQADAQRRGVPAPARTPAAAAVPAAGQQPTTVQRPGAPGVVPASASAAPGSAAPASGVVSAPAPATAAGAGAAAGAAAAAAPNGAPSTASTAPADADATQAIPAVPAAAAAAPSASPAAVPATPAPSTAAAAASARPAVPARPEPLASARPAARRPGPPPVIEPEPHSGNRTILAVVGGGLAVIVVAILLITQVFGGSDNKTSPTQASTPTTTSTPVSTPATTTSTTSPAVTPPVRGNFTVYVLNGTQTNGAAGKAGTQLQTSGYRLGGTKTAVTQTIAKTIVAYRPGAKAAAIDVAKLLGLTPASVAPATPNDVVAGGPSTNVIVTLGADAVK